MNKQKFEELISKAPKLIDTVIETGLGVEDAVYLLNLAAETSYEPEDDSRPNRFRWSGIKDSLWVDVFKDGPDSSFWYRIWDSRESTKKLPAEILAMPTDGDIRDFDCTLKDEHSFREAGNLIHMLRNVYGFSIIEVLAIMNMHNDNVYTAHFGEIDGEMWLYIARSGRWIYKYNHTRSSVNTGYDEFKVTNSKTDP